MAPVATHEDVSNISVRTKNVERQYLRSSGSLDHFEHDEITPVIGREFPKVNLVDDVLNAPDAEARIRDLAIAISERGVVFFRAQNNLTNDLQKTLIHRLGELTGKPKDSSLHIHPILNDSDEFGVKDAEISTISSKGYQKFKLSAAQWHTDISFEPAPANYTSLRLTQLPKTGGDTLWASGYEMYDRISEPYQRFLEGLTAAHIGSGFHDVVARGQATIYEKPRGSPLNAGSALEAEHPVIRTNPVTGWKSLFGAGVFPKVINGVSKDEETRLKSWFLDLILQNHDLQVRFKWKNENDIAIWDNRSVYHTATFDYHGLGDRSGNRVVGIGEQPFYDPNSKSRRTALAEREAATLSSV